MSFANYVRKYDVGSIRLDAPYAHFVHELPLLSFGDVLHTINLSLVYQSKMGNNRFNFMPGFGLNLHKRLVTGETYAHAYMSGNGNSISLSASSTSGISTFKDDSQRIVRKVNGRFIVENPDYSTEEFDENDNIRLVKDKYGNKILEYTYSEGRLISIAYRPESTNKKVNIVYTEAGLPTSISYIVDNATICTTDFVHMENGGIKVQHYSGVDYYVVSSASMFMAYSRDRDVSMDRSYYHSIECTTETDNVSKTIAVINKIGTEIENSITYHFPKFTDDKISVVDVTDYNNTTTRVQFLNDKPAYSYDLLDNPFNTDNELEDGRFLGGVTFYSNMNVAGVQKYSDGLRMNRQNNQYRDSHHFDAISDVEGPVTLSGWVKPRADINECTINIYIGGKLYSPYKVENLLPNVWTFFSFSTYLNAFQCIHVVTEEDDETIYARDFKIFCPRTSISNGADDYNDKIIKTQGVIIYENSYVPIDKEVDFYNGAVLIGSTKITVNDLIRYKAAQAVGEYKNEIYCDNGKGLLTVSGDLYVRFNFNGSLIMRSVKELTIGNLHSVGTNNYLTKTDFFEEDGQTYCKVVTFRNSELYKTEIYNHKFDLIKSIDFTEINNKISTELTLNPSNGLILSSTTKDDNNTCEVTKSATYSSDFFLLTATDEFGVVTTYTTDPIWGVVTRVTQSNGTKTFDTFDDDFSTHLGRIFSEDTTEEREHIFNYQNGNLFSMRTGSLLYKFGYSDLGDLANVTKNNLTIETHVINRNDNVITSTYGNHSFTKRYDKYDRLTQIDGIISNSYDVDPHIVKDDENNYHFEVINKDNSSSKLASQIDLTNGKTTKFAYSGDHISYIGVYDSSDNQVSNEQFLYDAAGRANYHFINYDIAAEKTAEEEIVYRKDAMSDGADSTIYTYSYLIDGVRKSYSINNYDVFNRISSKRTTISPQNIYFQRNISYDKTRVEKLEDMWSDSPRARNTYGYFSDGKIKTDSYTNQNRNYYTRYQYDSLGQLTREDNEALDKTLIYCYDNIGNISEVKEYDYTLLDTPAGECETTSYSYNQTHKDRLISYDGEEITYDSYGYPNSYQGKIWQWENGKLKKMYRGSDTQYGSVYEESSFSYDAYGRRTRKYYSYDPVVGVSGDGNYHCVTTYDYDHSGRLIHELCKDVRFNNSEITTHDLTYLYDETGIIGVNYSHNGATAIPYYYRKNLQGDVTAMYRSDGTIIAEYHYDAYGNCTISPKADYEIAIYNPIRYRSYYYDKETKLYYLNARYYNPAWRRFISPDDTAYLDPDVPNGLNLYCYCNNDPVNYADPSGHEALPNWLKWVIGGVAFVGAVALTALTGGALTPVFIGMASSIVFGGLAGGISSCLQGEEFWSGFADGAANGAMWGGICALSAASIRYIRYAHAVRTNNYDSLAKLFTHNKFSSKVMLGKYDGGGPTSYIAKAGHTHTYFKMPSRIFSKLSLKYGDDIWMINQSFLDQQVGKTFCFSHSIENATGYFLREIQYLKSRGVI